MLVLPIGSHLMNMYSKLGDRLIFGLDANASKLKIPHCVTKLSTAGLNEWFIAAGGFLTFKANVMLRANIYLGV